MEAYLDNAATTRAADEVAKVVTDIMLNDYGNPSSKHSKGFDAEKQVKQAAQIIAKTLKCDEKEILFTSGGTESNNMAIIESAIANKRRGNHVIVSSVEHSSVKEPFRYLEENGFNVTYLPVDNRGLVSVDALKEALDEETILVSVMLVNNEIGTIEPVEKIGKIVKDYNKDIIFHVDAIQAYGKMRIYPKKMNIDLLSVSGHKIHGPKGTGFLFIKDKTNLVTADLICHGTPSPYLLKKCLQEYGHDINTLTDINFRIKSLYELNRDGKPIAAFHTMDNYLIAFLHSYDYTENCYSCKFATLDRVSDITLGDSWGTELSGEVKNGVSLILCQSEKGKELIESAGLNLLDVDINNAISHNEQLNKPSKCSKSRDQFFENYNRYNNFGKALVKTAPGIVAKEKVKSIVKYIVRWGGAGFHDYSKRR